MTSEIHHGRINAHRKVLKTGRIEFAGSSLDCVVRSLSETGAGLEITSPLWFPDSFTLVIESDGLIRSCRIAWRADRRVGVIFA